MRSGDPEFRPPGVRTLWLEDFAMPDEVWTAFQIPIGLAFLLRSSVTGSVVALYPSPAGATESELELSAWDALCEANPVLDRLEPDAEALIVNRTGAEHQYAIVPTDQAYRLVGLVKSRWEGISGGQGLERRGRRLLRRPAGEGPGACVDAPAGGMRPAPPTEPVFSVLGVEPVPFTAQRRRCASTCTSTDPLGREIHTIALSTQIQIDPARRAYDPETQARLVELFGPPERWASTTQALRWAQCRRSSRASPARPRSRSRSRAPTTSRSRRASTSTRCRAARSPSRSSSTAWCSTAAAADRLQVAQVPWSCTARWRMPVAAWKHVMDAYYPGGGWVRLTPPRSTRSRRARRPRAPLLRRAGGGAPAMSRLDELVDTLLWEGHQLYPYTPSATKNATPTPFGIVYPAAYAAGSPHTFDRLKLQCIATGTAQATVHFLQGAEAQRVELLEEGVVELRLRAGARAGVDDDRGLRRAGPGDRGRGEHDRGRRRPRPAPRPWRSSLLSTHVVVRCGTGGRFMSPISPPEDAATAVMTCANVNTFPVLATAADDAVLGAAIMLPDHPEIAPESRGSLFDSTEIEEALLLHVLALSDGERRELGDADPAVRR